jgi:molybdopterin converting factor small subunit
MAHVKLMGPLRTLAGIDALHIEAHNIRSLLAALAERVPAIAAEIEAGVAVAVDGQIFQDTLLHPIAADAEVHVLPQIAGG